MDSNTQQVQLGPYTLTQRIGSGGMAEVWKAEREKMGAYQTVAIKLLNAASREKQEYRQMFLDEARLSMALRHSSIVQVFDVGEYAGECFITMEWVDGINLSELTSMMWERGESLPLHVSVHIVGEVLRALDQAHNAQSHGSTGVVHRDISPQNVMLSVSGEVKIMDFGVARFSSEETNNNFLKGKVRYMAPEQIKMESRDPIIDLFAVGAVFHELLEGRRFRASATTDVELFRFALDGIVPPLTNPAAVPAPVLTVLWGLLEPKPSLRIGSARGALRMLGEWTGYRNAALELEAVVLRYRGAVGQPEAANGASAARQIQARIEAHLELEGSGRQGAARALSPWLGVNASTETTFEHVDPEAVDATSVGSIWSNRSTRATRSAAVMVALLALSLGSATVMFAVTRSQGQAPQSAARSLSQLENPDDSAPPPLASKDEVQVPAVSPAGIAESTATEPTAAAEPDSETGSDLDLDLDLDLDDLDVNDDQAVAAAPPDPPAETKTDNTEQKTKPQPAADKARKQNVDVTFVLGQRRYVEIKVGAMALNLKANKKLQLREGPHTVKMRDSETNEWRKVARIRLKAGHRYEVRMLIPHGVKLVELD